MGARIYELPGLPFEDSPTVAEAADEALVVDLDVERYQRQVRELRDGR